MGKVIGNVVLKKLKPSVRDSVKKIHTVSQPKMWINYAWLEMSKACGLPSTLLGWIAIFLIVHYPGNIIFSNYNMQ